MKFRRLLSSLLAFVLALGLVPTAALAAAQETEGWENRQIENGMERELRLLTRDGEGEGEGEVEWTYVPEEDLNPWDVDPEETHEHDWVK